MIIISILEMSNNKSESVLQVGAVVEVKNQDGVYQEATINKLTDASIYTVGKSMTNHLLFPLSPRITADSKNRFLFNEIVIVDSIRIC